ncbi:hypothetical protein BZG36_00892 [Bifiguratus adelaidae]|uniref:t-SNARE coiled-coil homology domain-containing protein n=1 Tax=Bifiguratus adelaidae TaxID=1938954 RepID=A0A261Y5Y6_9FUNG|nr:hypothetical protein BZG36_00892 [Bifiguratus adelaidae]
MISLVTFDVRSRERTLRQTSNSDDYPPSPTPPLPIPTHSSHRNTPSPHSPSRRQDYQDTRYRRYEEDVYDDYYDERNHAPQRYDQYPYDKPSTPQPRTPPTPSYSSKSYKKYDDYQENDYEMREVKKSRDWDSRNTKNVPLDDQDAFFEEIGLLKLAIKDIGVQISLIEDHHSRSLAHTSDREQERNAKELEALMDETQKMNQNVKKRIKALELQNARMKNSPDHPMRLTQIGQLKDRFLDTIRRFQNVERDFRKRYRAQIERQILMVNKDATQEDIEQALDSDNPQIFAQSLMNAQRSGQARAVLHEVQTRHDDIKKIEKTILELHQLFMDMQTLVETQGEVIDKIEDMAEATVVNIDEGNKQVDQAVASSKSTRKKKWLCFWLVIIIVIALAFVIWWFALNHVGLKLSKT